MDSDAIQTTVRAYFESFNASDVEGILATLAADGSIMADGMATVTGPEQIREVFEGAFGVMRYRFDFAIDRILVEGTMATVQAHANGTVTTLGTGSTTAAPQHRELFVLRKRDGAWLITDYMFNMTGDTHS
jgi:uncharacterized protein (TIGR02246 family)